MSCYLTVITSLTPMSYVILYSSLHVHVIATYSVIHFTRSLFSGAVDRETLAQQKRLLSKQLGLDVGASLGLPGSDLIADEDLVMHESAAREPASPLVWTQDSLSHDAIL